MKKQDKIALLVLAMIVILGSTYSYFKYRKIHKKGIFIVAETIYTTRGKSGSTVHFIYRYKGKEYESNFKPEYEFDLNIGRKFYIQILPDNPSQYNYFNIDVPPCALQEHWEKGWEQIPECE